MEARGGAAAEDSGGPDGEDARADERGGEESEAGGELRGHAARL